MDRNAFTPNATGRIVPLELPNRRDWSFVPDPLPPRWKLPERLWPLFTEAHGALEKLDGIGQALSDPELLLMPLQNKEAVASSSIEGTFVTPEQLLLYKLDPKEPISAGEVRADWQEVHAYSRAMAFGCEQLKSLPICNRVIKGMHHSLMSNVRGRDKDPGEFRRLHVQVGSSGRYIPPLASEVAPLMNDLEAYINDDASDLHPLIKAFIIHYQFEAIHPFKDGNGRVGRALLAVMIFKYLGHSKPWLYLSAFFEKFKDEYIRNLFLVSADGRWNEWVEFCLNGTLTQATDSIRRCHRFIRLKKEFHSRVTDPTPRSHAIVEGLFIDAITNIRTIADRHNIAYNTAKRDLERLVQSGILRELPETHPTAFFAPEIMSAAYEPLPE